MTVLIFKSGGPKSCRSFSSWASTWLNEPAASNCLAILSQNRHWTVTWKYSGMNSAPKPEQRPSTALSQTVQWVERAQAGDRTAFHRLADRFQPEIYRMVYYRIQSQMDAEDLTQDIFLQAFKNLVNLKSPQVFRPWLYRIAINRVRDFYRRKKFRNLFGFVSVEDKVIQHEPEMAVAPQADAELKRAVFWQRVEESLTKLSRLEREVFMLRFFDQLSIKEVTATLNKNESTVKTHLYRALRKLKNGLSDLQEIWEGL
jgi:RNA polymerase sigma-70 factor, ECF subfamily